MNELTAALREHYARGPLYQDILANLARKQVDLARVRPADLYPYDQFHVGGVETTRALARRATLAADEVVIDIGCGAGGAARCLRAEFACRVIGVDLTAEMLQLAGQLNQLAGLSAEIPLLAAQAESLPLPSGFADAVWTQHVTMNLPDHREFLQEAARVLKPSGRFVGHEWLVNGSGALPFPLPWASHPSLNHALPAERFLELLRQQGFTPVAEDLTASMREVLQTDLAALTARSARPQRVARLTNLLQAATEGLLCCWMVVASRQPESPPEDRG